MSMQVRIYNLLKYKIKHLIILLSKCYKKKEFIYERIN